MQEQPIVSIQCLVYNHEPYLRQCLDGFVMQKTNFKFEAIVHDDVSTDGSAAIIREYAEKYPDIIKPIFETENQYSKHDGSLDRIMHEACKGKYIAMCEGDDYWIDPLKLQKQVDFMEANPDYSMCFHNAVKYYVQENRIALFNNYKTDCDLSVHDAIHNWYVPTASMLYRKSILTYSDWLQQIYSGDYRLILLALNAGKIRYLNGFYSVYRINTNGTSMSAIMQGKSIFIYQQHILLLTSFLSGTNSSFEIEVNDRINWLKSEIKFLKLKQKHLIYTILMPQKMFNKIIRRYIKTLVSH